MANTAHCLYCFEVLSAKLEKRKALSLEQVEDSWNQYSSSTGLGASQDGEDADDHEMTEDEVQSSDDGEEDDVDEAERQKTPSVLLPPSISRLQAPSPGSGSSASTPSSLSTTSSQAALGDASKSSSKSSFFSFSRKSESQSPLVKTEEKYPLFVTWNTIDSRGHKSLRGCIGTFEAQELSVGLKTYALTSALDDDRFSPISLFELPSLSVDITLLTSFTPCAHPLEWDLETHGVRISFTHHGRRYGSTYLPGVALEQGWTKEETIVSLMRKAGWSGRSGDWKKVVDLKCIRYEGMKSNLAYEQWKEWRSWVEQEAKGR